MTDELLIERELILDGDVAEVWPLLATAEGWQQWLVDAADVAIVEGAGGKVVDDGVVRDVRFIDVEDERGLTFQWWERDDPSSASQVRIEAHPLVSGGTRVLIVERQLSGAAMKATAREMSSNWEVRALLLALTQCTLARV
jgi:uncharacterized protein YndB with AHSA1/START domain